MNKVREYSGAAIGKSNERSILVVDDDKTIRKLIRIVLKGLQDIEILESDNGRSALEIIAKQNIKTIITDIELPGMGGIEFISAVRNTGRDTPVIFISGHVDKYIALKALRLGAFDFIEKPFQNNVLLTTVTNALAKGNVGLPAKLQKLNLNTTQVKVLEMLMNGLSNKEIGDIVNLSEQGVKYHISNLFKKFETSDRVELRGKVWEMIDVQSPGPQKGR